MSPQVHVALEIGGLTIAVLNFLLTLYFVVFKLGRWMGKMDEFKKHVTEDMKTLKRRVFGAGTAWRPMTEMAEARQPAHKK